MNNLLSASHQPMPVGNPQVLDIVAASLPEVVQTFVVAFFAFVCFFAALEPGLFCWALRPVKRIRVRHADPAPVSPEHTRVRDVRPSKTPAPWAERAVAVHSFPNVRGQRPSARSLASASSQQSISEIPSTPASPPHFFRSLPASTTSERQRHSQYSWQPNRPSTSER